MTREEAGCQQDQHDGFADQVMRAEPGDVECVQAVEEPAVDPRIENAVRRTGELESEQLTDLHPLAAGTRASWRDHLGDDDARSAGTEA